MSTATIESGQIIPTRPERKTKAAPDFTDRQAIDLAPSEIMARFCGAFPGLVGPLTSIRIGQEAADHQDRHDADPTVARSHDRVGVLVVVAYLATVIEVKPQALANFFDRSLSWVDQAIRLGRVLIREREGERMQQIERRGRSKA